MQNSPHVARFILEDQHLHGSGRLGLKKRNQMVYGKKFTGSYNSGLLDYTVSGAAYVYEPVVDETSYRQQRGLKRYEFANHLGNVLAVASDRLLSVPVVSTTTHDHYTADILQAQDYYPFGMMMPGRSYQASANERAYSPVTVLASSPIETFEDDDEGWETFGGTAIQDPTLERLEVTSSTAWHGTRKDYTTVAGEQYRFKFDLDMGDFANIHVQINNKVGGSTTTLVYDLVKSTGTLEYTFTATGTTTRLFIRRGGNGVNKTFYLDNVEFSKLSAADAGQLMAVSEGYRYGFNGMERDDEWNGVGNSYTTHFRQYDTRLGRWFAVDPKTSWLPHLSPYNSMGNNPVLYNDPRGDYFDPESQVEIDDFKAQTIEKMDAAQAEKDKLDGQKKLNPTQQNRLNYLVRQIGEFNDAISEVGILEKSSQLYTITHNSVPGKGGELSFRITGTTPDIRTESSFKWTGVVIINSSQGITSLAHELKHAYQFETGYLSFGFGAAEGGEVPLTPRSAIGKGGVLYDLNDEVEAYKRQFAYNNELVVPTGFNGGTKKLWNFRDVNANNIKPFYSNLTDIKGVNLNVNTMVDASWLDIMGGIPLEPEYNGKTWGEYINAQNVMFARKNLDLLRNGENKPIYAPWQVIR